MKVVCNIDFKHLLLVFYLKKCWYVILNLSKSDWLLVATNSITKKLCALMGALLILPWTYGGRRVGTRSIECEKVVVCCGRM